jgi:DNA modification methylase
VTIPINQIICGDNIDTLRTLPDACVDSCVTDPPYGLEFMGKQWDKGVPGVELWREVLRVLKPGGHLLAFAGTRTQHRMATAIEDAGFEIRDMIAWVYGCLSEDTELLINGRWEHYSKAIDGGLALCYDVEHDEYRWEAIQDFVEYVYSDTAYRIQSDRTDQIVSRNHRCLVERGGRYVFRLAETLEREETVPILEGVPEMFGNLPLPNQRASSEKSVLQPRVHAKKSRKSKAAVRTQGAGCCVCELWQESVEAGCVAEKSENTLLQPILSGEVCHRTDFDSEQIRPNRNEVSRYGNERGKKPGVEGWCHVLSQARQLQADQVCEMPGGILCDGSQGRLCDGAQARCCKSHWAMSFENGSCSSHRPRSSEQCNNEPDAVRKQPRPQVIRGEGHTIADLVTVTPIHYVGNVWCIRVPTGAFVARRNGKVFVTGNSGFPKSLDVSKAIDKAAGAEGDCGPMKRGGERLARLQDGKRNGDGRWGDESGRNPFTYLPATEAAKQWAGWGTALKPSLEPITVARKPLCGTVAENVLQHGTGGLNVDGCRVGTTVETWPASRSFSSGISSGYTDGIAKGETQSTGTAPPGRWPANLIHDGSEEVVGLFPETAPSKQSEGVSRKNGVLKHRGENARPSHDTFERTTEAEGYSDSGSAARFFYCAKAGPEERRQSKHPTIKPVALMRYLVRLVTPPGGLVLDPFGGSGTTAEAARLEHCRYLLMELNSEYCADAAERLRQGVLF